MMNKFGKKIEALRTARNLSVKEVASMLSIPQSRLIELERGVRIPESTQVNRMETFYEVPHGDLAALVYQPTAS